MQWNMSDNVFANNIVYAGPHCLISVTKTEVNKSQPPALIDHNLYYCAAGAEASTWAEVSGTITGFNNYVQSTGNDQHSRFLDPHFVDAAAHNFHLQSGSPALAEPPRIHETRRRNRCGPSHAFHGKRSRFS